MKTSTRNLAGIAAVLQVAEKGSFKLASHALGISTSATSKAVARLEAELGVKLFHRTTRSVGLTAEGERYVAGVGPLLAELDALTCDIRDQPSSPRGSLRVSAPGAFARAHLAPRLARFIARYPAISLDLALEDRYVDLAAEGVDVAIRTGPLADNASLIARRLFCDHLALCASPSYLDERGVPRTPEDLHHHRCVVFRNPRTGRPEPWQLGDGRPWHVESSLAIGDMDALTRALCGHAGIGQVPGYLARGHLERGELREVLPEHRAEGVAFTALYLNRDMVAPRIRAFIDFLVAESSQMPL